MGDPRRHDALADLIADRWPDRSARIADVAGGKADLNAALYRRGYRNVVTFDKRRKRYGRANYVYGTFGAHVSQAFDLVVAMHPDAATDVAMDWAIRRGVPYAVVPCCTRPAAWVYDGANDQDQWIGHLVARSLNLGRAVEVEHLPIHGANRVLIGCPRNGSSVQ